MPELLLCCTLRCSHSRLLCALRCCLLLLQLCIHLKHLLSSTFHPFFTGFCHFRCQLFFVLVCHFFFFINSCAFSYYLSYLPPDESCESCRQNVVNSTVCCSLNYYTSILFVLHKCGNFFIVAHFYAAIVVFSARSFAASCSCNFAFCSTT